MKKVIALLLALVMVCGLVACGAKEPAVDAPADNPADAPAEEKKPVEAEPEKELEPITITWAIFCGLLSKSRHSVCFLRV